MSAVSGTEGYAEKAGGLAKRFEGFAFADIHKDLLCLIPAQAALVLDVGSGSGRDAAALAAMGHDVVAIEPTRELRKKAKFLHPSARIEWLDDSLPELVKLTSRKTCFNLIMLTAVWSTSTRLNAD